LILFQSLVRPQRLLCVARTFALSAGDLAALQSAAVAHIAVHGSALPGWPM